MPIAFAKVAVHSRSHGHSAVAGAAYRAGQKLLDARTGEVHNFKNRDDVLYENIMLPDKADSKFQDREVLWNEVEFAEKRKDSQVAKDILLALPKEVSLDEQVEMTRNFAHTHFVSKGLAADIAIHNKQDGNPHAHIYVTTRRIVGDQLDPKKARDLNPGFSQGGFIPEKDYWGEEWRDFQNGFFQEKGLSLTVDANHIVPQVHEGRVRGDETHYLKEENQLRREASIEIALNSPESLLNILATKKEVFSERDIASLIFKNTDKEAEYKEAYTTFKAHPDLMFLGYGEDGRERYTSRGNYEREVELSDHVDSMVLEKSQAIPKRQVNTIAKQYGLTEEQQTALSHIATSGKICAVVGRAGTGKTYMLKAVQELYSKEGYNLIGMAVAGVAAKNLQNDTGIKSHTIYSIKKRIELGTLRLSENDVLVMDEAGMTDLNDMAEIIFYAKQAGAKVLLVGDHAQLQPVGKGAPFRIIVERAGFAEIETVMRQKDPEDRVATILLSKGQIGAAVEHYHAKGQISFLENEAEAMEALSGDWKQHISKENLANTVIAAFTNEEVNALNLRARKELIDLNLVSTSGREFITAKGKTVLAEGDRILFLKNNKDIGVNNGDFATITKINKHEITAKISEKTTVTFNVEEYNNFNYGYAATVHKLQGSTLDDVFPYVGSKGWDKYLSYVAFSRHRENLKIYVNKENHKDLKELKTNLSRNNFRDSVLDWPLAYSLRRNFEADSTVNRFVDKALKVKESIKDKWLFVVNYEAYLNKKEHLKRLDDNVKRRNEARKVAAFVDTHRELGKKWSEMNKELLPDSKIAGHPEYLATYEQMLVKNQVASELYKEADKYVLALDANHMTLEQLEKASSAHHKFINARNYLQDRQAGKSIYVRKLAQEIHTNIKDHYSAIGYLSRKNNLQFWDIINDIKDTALKYERSLNLQKLTGAERERFIIVDDYYWLNRGLKDTWREVYKNGGIDSLSNNQLKAIHQKTAKCDKLAYEICKHPERFGKELTHYSLDIEKLTAFKVRHLNRSKVVELAGSRHTLKREEMAADLLADKRYYRYIHELELDWKELYKARKAYIHKQKLLGSTKEEQLLYRTVLDYQQARISAAIAWSKLIEDQNSGKEIAKSRQNSCWKLIEARNSFAYKIALDPKKYAPFLKDTKLKVADLEKHAVAYSKHLERQEKWQKEKYRRRRDGYKKPAKPIAPLKKDSNGKEIFNYQAINDALISMGEEFYEQVIGFSGKKEGGAIAYREGNALLYSPGGSKAGSWHSFSSGEGGGPIQLLMSSTHGWGLSYENALKEGARLAGLSSSEAIVNHQQQQPQITSADKAKQEEENIKTRIAAARYYYNSAKPIEGTIGEKYLREIRGIEGDISWVKYHPRIRDSKLITDSDGKAVKDAAGKERYRVTYHPGIVVAAYNKDKELTGCQTILLDPKTCNKVNAKEVGAVKRSRGLVKGSAVQVQAGSSNKVIIAEGNETGGSLIKAAPEANIYVTLGNIKNATSLEWLAEKHQTKEFYFAADNDGPGAANIKALREVAAELKYSHDIDCYMALSHLEGREKTDFNDVSREKGPEEVAKQLADMQRIPVPERKTIVHGEELKERIQGGLGEEQPPTAQPESQPDNNAEAARQQGVDENKSRPLQSPIEAFSNTELEWDKVSDMHDAGIELILKYRKISGSRAPGDREELNAPVKELIEDTANNKHVMEQVKSKAPKLAEYFANYASPDRGQMPVIDWKSDEYSKEWDKLRGLDKGEGAIYYLVKFRDIAHKKQNPDSTKRAYESMNDLIKEVVENKGLFDKVRRASPLLAGLFQSHSKGLERFVGKSKNRGRDR